MAEKKVETKAAPTAVELLPSIPLVPRLQKTDTVFGRSNNCA